MEAFDYLAPKREDDPYDLNRADFERAELYFLMESARKSGKQWGESEEEMAATEASFRRRIEQHNLAWADARAKDLAWRHAVGGSTCPACATAIKPGAKFCVGCGAAVTVTPP